MGGELSDAVPPPLAVVLVTDSDAAPLRRTLEHLDRQTRADRLEVLVVGPAGSSTEGAELPIDPGRFASFRWIEAEGAVDSLDRARALAVPHVTAPAVAFIEDHAYPEPEWAEAVIAAHDGPWAAVGAALVNANPATLASWANLLTAYGDWTEPVPDGEVEALPGHNTSYRTDLLRALAADPGDPAVPSLGDLLERGGGLHEELRRHGGRFYLASGARVAHVNPSRWRSTLPLRLDAGRLYAAGRVRSEGWGLGRRVLYALTFPLIPALRLARLFTGDRRPSLGRLPAYAVGYGLDAAGQAVGYLIGAGKSLERLEAFEIDRFRHLVERDRKALGVA